MTTARRIVTVLGARPQFIKASAVSAAVAATPGLSETIVHTGQHFDANMSDVFFAELGIPKPAHNLDIHGGAHGDMTGRMLAGIEQLLLADRPDAVLVYGDTNSTLAGALAAAKLHIPVAHVEAGLRSFNMKMPEEINRVLTDRISDWLFAPTTEAVGHLRNEGVPESRVHQVGDVMYDVARLHGARVCADEGVMKDIAVEPGRYVLATIHRAENTDVPERLAIIVDALIALAVDLPVVWPLHPRTRAILEKSGQFARVAESLTLIEPLGYLDMVRFEKYAALIATDSGGVQKEAFFYSVPCVTLRDETEWVELVASGWNRLAPPTSSDALLAQFHAALGSSGEAVTPYGDGHSAEAIVAVLAQALRA
jgi:UDP-GlcNAc3NAcA epimerase